EALSLLGLRAPAQNAASQLAETESRGQRAERELADAVEDESSARQARAEALAGLKQVDSAAAATSGKLGALAGAARAAQDEAGRLSAAIASAERAREKDLTQLADLQGRLAACEAEAPDGPGVGAEHRAEEPLERDPVDKNALAAAAVAARNAEMEARLQVRTLEERLRAVAGRGDALASAAAAERQAIQRAKARSIRREQEAAVADAVPAGATPAVAAIARPGPLADSERRAAERASHGRDDELKTIRARIRELTAD